MSRQRRKPEPSLALSMMDVLFGTFGAVIILNVMFSILQGGVKAKAQEVPDEFYFLRVDLDWPEACTENEKAPSIRAEFHVEIQRGDEYCSDRIGVQRDTRHSGPASGAFAGQDACSIEVEDRPQHFSLGERSWALLIPEQTLYQEDDGARKRSDGSVRVSFTQGEDLRRCNSMHPEQVTATLSAYGKQLQIPRTNPVPVRVSNVSGFLDPTRLVEEMSASPFGNCEKDESECDVRLCVEDDRSLLRWYSEPQVGVIECALRRRPE